jgi:anaerobic carbon-monoxide dehydrogenase iron sulfur subunit
MRITVDNSKCTGCLICEITCSLLHHGQVRREASAIQVTLNDLTHGFHQPVLCRQCKKMMCWRSEGKAVAEKRRESFIWEGPKEIRENCAFGAVFAFEDRWVHCNLCGGDPECVKSCPTGALRFDGGDADASVYANGSVLPLH